MFGLTKWSNPIEGLHGAPNLTSAERTKHYFWLFRKRLLVTLGGIAEHITMSISRRHLISRDSSASDVPAMLSSSSSSSSCFGRSRGRPSWLPSSESSLSAESSGSSVVRSKFDREESFRTSGPFELLLLRWWEPRLSVRSLFFWVWSENNVFVTLSMS